MKDQPTYSVYVLTDYEPLRMGLVAVVGDAPYLAVAGSASTLDELGGDGAAGSADVFLVDSGTLVHAPAGIAGAMLSLPRRQAVLLAANGDQQTLIADVAPALPMMDGFAILGREVSGYHLTGAIRLVAERAFLCDIDALRGAYGNFADMVRGAREGSMHVLSLREQQVLRLVARGSSNKEIARQLTVSEGTVKAHVSHIMAKLGAANRTELAAYVLSSERPEPVDGHSRSFTTYR